MDKPHGYQAVEAVDDGHHALQPSPQDAFLSPQSPFPEPKDPLSSSSGGDDGTSYRSHVGQGLSPPRPPRPRPRRASPLFLLKSWGAELLCCLISIVCLVALVLVLRAYDDRPLPAWSGGITLNTVVALLSTVCRTLFVVAASQALSQAKWNWFRGGSPRPLKDLTVFDDASRGPWGSLKLVVTMKGRVLGIMMAVLMVTSLLTSTLTQSVITYPSRGVPSANPADAVAFRSEGYFWATANANSKRDIMFKPNLAIRQALYTPATEPVDLTAPICRTSNCTWEAVSSLSVCVKYKNVTDQLSVQRDKEEVDVFTNWNWTLPNGLRLQWSAGYANLNISTGPSLSFNDTAESAASLFNFFIIYATPEQRAGESYLKARAYEAMMHWCINTHDVRVSDNIPSMNLTASHTIVKEGEIFIQSYNQTKNTTYLVSPTDPGGTYAIGGMSDDAIRVMLANTMCGNDIYRGGRTLDSGVQAIMTAISDATSGPTQPSSQTVDEKEFASYVGITTNVANGLTNSFSVDNISGKALQQETYVLIRWEWLSLVVAQVVLAIIALVFVVAQTAMLDMDIVKNSLLATMFTIGAEERASLEEDLRSGHHDVAAAEKEALEAHGIAGELRRRGRYWILGGEVADR